MGHFLRKLTKIMPPPSFQICNNNSPFSKIIITVFQIPMLGVQIASLGRDKFVQGPSGKMRKIIDFFAILCKAPKIIEEIELNRYFIQKKTPFVGDQTRTFSINFEGKVAIPSPRSCDCAVAAATAGKPLTLRRNCGFYTEKCPFFGENISYFWHIPTSQMATKTLFFPDFPTWTNLSLPTFFG